MTMSRSKYTTGSRPRRQTNPQNFSGRPRFRGGRIDLSDGSADNLRVERRGYMYLKWACYTVRH
jgi:hypothetical protein